MLVYQRRTYYVAASHRAEFEARFNDIAAPLLAEHGATIVRSSSDRTGGWPVTWRQGPGAILAHAVLAWRRRRNPRYGREVFAFSYGLEWADRDELRRRWTAFRDDPRWVEAKREMRERVGEPVLLTMERITER